MALPLPLPLKVAAGLVVTGVERIRSLPADLSALPVQAAGYALRLSMKVQQEIAELATKGDETLGAVFGGSQPERSPLATFDDDLPTAAPTRPSARAARATGPVDGARRPTGRDAQGPGRPTPTAGRPGRRGVPPTVPVVPPGATIDGVPVPGAEPTEEATATGGTGPASPDLATTDVTGPSDAETADVGPVGESPSTPPETVLPADWSVTRQDPLAERADDFPAATDEPAPPVTEEPDPVVWTTATDEPIAGPPDIVVPLPLPDYDQLSVAQVRGHLRRLTADDVQALLEHEQRNGDRAPFLTLLSNRLVTLQHSS